jgi:hypothetical protein
MKSMKGTKDMKKVNQRRTELIQADRNELHCLPKQAPKVLDWGR